MEKFMRKENVYMGEDMDFNDVFGGPPRRFSMQEVRERYSFGGESSSEEKPVFGEERRRQKGADFFDDIFKGSPRRSDRDSGGAFGSNPGSRIMSPARPFSPKPDALLGSSLPTQFSLPAKSTKVRDLPTYGLSSPHSSTSPFSRFSNEATRSVDEMIRNEAHPVNRQRQFSDEAEDSQFNAITDEKETIENLSKDMSSVDSIGDQFHFSIYKWAGRGVPMLMPLVIGNNLKSKDSVKYEKSSSSNGRMESKSSPARNRERAQGEKKHEQNYVADAFYELSEAKSQSRPNDSVVYNRNVKEEQVKSVDVSAKISEGLKSELKPLHAFLDEGDQPGDDAQMKHKKARAPGVHGDAYDIKKVKEKGRKGLDLNNAKVEKSNLQGAAANLGEAEGKSAAAKGKVKEFVQIFNQEVDSRPKADDHGSRRQGSVGIDQIVNEASSNQEKVKEQVNLLNVDKKPDVSFKVVENLKNDEAQRVSPRRASSSTRSSSRLRKSFSAGTLHEDLEMSQENLDDPLEDNFEVHELSDGNESVTQNESSEDTKAIDAKIRQWSVGKKGNIRSLLSTLQYVLWAESGWKAVPLVDLIDANSVKKAYQKALLRLHPDKLQQKGAPFHHKYIAEKVFDILQEAWDHFNTCSSLGI